MLRTNLDGILLTFKVKSKTFDLLFCGHGVGQPGNKHAKNTLKYED